MKRARSNQLVVFIVFFVFFVFIVFLFFFLFLFLLFVFFFLLFFFVFFFVFFFRCFDEKQNTLRVYVPRMKVLIFADLMYYRIVTVENTQAQSFANLISNCTRVFSTKTTWLCIKIGDINALFLATFSEPILVSVRTRKKTASYRFERALFAKKKQKKKKKLFFFFHCFV